MTGPADGPADGGAAGPGASRRRGNRRVVRPPTGGPGSSGDPGVVDGASGVSADDGDTGWGEAAPVRPPVGRDDPRGPVSAEDEQYLRDRPPHWG